MTTPLRPPKDGIRAMPPGSLQGDGKTLTGRLATGWAEIESVAEGHFMERFAPGAFRKTFTENRDNIKVLFQHGRDNDVGPAAHRRARRRGRGCRRRVLPSRACSTASHR